MAKRQGRPKRVVEQVVKETTNENEAFSKVSEEEKPEPVDAKKALKLKAEEPIQSKVVEANTQAPQKTTKKPPSRNRMHEVFIKGKPRMVTVQTYEDVSKDPKLNVTLPKGSQLKPVEQPCENC